MDACGEFVDAHEALVGRPGSGDLEAVATFELGHRRIRDDGRVAAKGVVGAAAGDRPGPVQCAFYAVVHVAGCATLLFYFIN